MTNKWLCITLGSYLYFTEILVDASSPKKQTTLLLPSKMAHSTNLRRQAGTGNFSSLPKMIQDVRPKLSFYD